MSEKKNKHPLGVGIYDLNDNLILVFNNVELTKHLNISKITAGKYFNSGFYAINYLVLKQNKVKRYRLIFGIRTS